jgi:hypothetical protein
MKKIIASQFIMISRELRQHWAAQQGALHTKRLVGQARSDSPWKNSQVAIIVLGY